MIGLDTNVLVRYIVQDDRAQSLRATAVIDALTRDDPGFIPLVTLVELVWVIESSYDAEKPEVVAILDRLLRTQELVIENAGVVISALDRFRKSKADFADCLIERSASAAGCPYTISFDEKAIKTAGMRAVD